MTDAGKDAQTTSFSYPAGQYAQYGYPAQYGYGYAAAPMTTSFAYQAAPAAYGSFYYGAPATTVAAPAATVATRDITSATPVAATTAYTAATPASYGYTGTVTTLPGYTPPAGYVLLEDRNADGTVFYRAVPSSQQVGTVATRDVTVAAATPVAAAPVAPAVAAAVPPKPKKRSCC